jgi:hypothetical protein
MPTIQFVLYYSYFGQNSIIFEQYISNIAQFCHFLSVLVLTALSK